MLRRMAKEKFSATGAAGGQQTLVIFARGQQVYIEASLSNHEDQETPLVSNCRDKEERQKRNSWSAASRSEDSRP